MASFVPSRKMKSSYAMTRRPREDGWRCCTSEKHGSSSYLKSVQKIPHSRESTSEPQINCNCNTANM
jgi:hypothetical protein